MVENSIGQYLSGLSKQVGSYNLQQKAEERRQKTEEEEQRRWDISQDKLMSTQKEYAKVLGEDFKEGVDYEARFNMKKNKAIMDAADKKEKDHKQFLEAYRKASQPTVQQEYVDVINNDPRWAELEELEQSKPKGDPKLTSLTNELMNVYGGSTNSDNGEKIGELLTKHLKTKTTNEIYGELRNNPKLFGNNELTTELMHKDMAVDKAKNTSTADAVKAKRELTLKLAALEDSGGNNSGTSSKKYSTEKPPTLDIKNLYTQVTGKSWSSKTVAPKFAHAVEALRMKHFSSAEAVPILQSMYKPPVHNAVLRDEKESLNNINSIKDYVSNYDKRVQKHNDKNEVIKELKSQIDGYTAIIDGKKDKVDTKALRKLLKFEDMRKRREAIKVKEALKKKKIEEEEALRKKEEKQQETLRLQIEEKKIAEKKKRDELKHRLAQQADEKAIENRLKILRARKWYNTNAHNFNWFDKIHLGNLLKGTGMTPREFLRRHGYHDK